MRSTMIALAVLAATAAIRTSAQAQNYPWCADYAGGVMGGSRNCGFSTYQQCAATVSGIGGFCNRNTQYAPSRNGPSSRYRPRRRDYQH